MRGAPYPLDMLDEVSDERFRPLGRDGTRQDRSAKSWWNGKVGTFAHAVAAALDGEPGSGAFKRFARGGWNHEVVNRYGYIQLMEEDEGSVRIRLRNGRIRLTELHWYEAHGIGKKVFKRKRYLD